VKVALELPRHCVPDPNSDLLRQESEEVHSILAGAGLHVNVSGIGLACCAAAILIEAEPSGMTVGKNPSSRSTMERKPSCFIAVPPLVVRTVRPALTMSHQQ
jgi:hypothetical protein